MKEKEKIIKINFNNSVYYFNIEEFNLMQKFIKKREKEVLKHIFNF